MTQRLRVRILLLPLLLGACGALESPRLPKPDGASGIAVSGGTVHLYNDEIVRTFVLREGAPRTVAVANRLAGEADVGLRDAAEFVLTLEGGRKLSDADFQAVGWDRETSPKGPARIRSTFRHNGTGLTVVVTYALESGRGVVRKGIQVEADGPPLLIDRIDLERFKPERPAVDHAGPGQPVYVGDLFWGCEYPSAENRATDGEVSLGHLVGIRLDHGTLDSRTAVVGAGFRGRVQESFFAYLDRLRAPRRSPFLVLSTRLDLSPYDEDQAKKSIAALVTRMKMEYGTPFHAYLLDAGWDAAGEPWILDATRFPGGWRALRQALDGSGASLGARLSASGDPASSAPVPDGTPAAPAVPLPSCCLGESAARKRFLDRVATIQREGGIALLRLDGFAAPCSDATHGHRAGPYAAVASTDAALETLAEIRRMSPTVFLLLGDGFWPSPWWLTQADALWRGGADFGFASQPADAPRRERWITFVDSILHREFRDRAQVPLHAVAAGAIIQGRLGSDLPEVQGTVGERDEHFTSWERMAVLACARGTFRADLHLAPAVTTRDQWTALSRWLRWAAERDSLLARGGMAGGDPSRGEPYAFVHALPERAILAVRNPSDRERLISLPVDAFPFLFSRDRTLRWRSVYPDAQAGEVKPGASWTTALPPFAVRVVELEPGD